MQKKTKNLLEIQAVLVMVVAVSLLVTQLDEWVIWIKQCCSWREPPYLWWWGQQERRLREWQPLDNIDRSREKD